MRKNTSLLRMNKETMAKEHPSDSKRKFLSADKGEKCISQNTLLFKCWSVSGTCSCCCRDFCEYSNPSWLLTNKQWMKSRKKFWILYHSLIHTHTYTHGPTAVSALHRVWQSLALAWPQRNGHSPSGATAVTFCVLKVVIPLQTQTQ